MQAAKWIDNRGVPVNRQSVHYDLVLQEKKYPPKYVISIAGRFATGVEHPAGNFNAVEAKNFFLSRGYEIVDRRNHVSQLIVPENDKSVFPEGAKKYKWHRNRERDHSIVMRAKVRRWEKFGKLECDVCSLDFGEMYGSHGKGFIEAHHTVPVSDLDGSRNTEISELAMVCSNCHRMLHRGRTLLTVDELRRIIQENQP